MNWLLHMTVVLLVFGPVVVGTLIWHIIWNNKSGPSSDSPPGGGPKRRPVPPPPRFSGDRTRKHPGSHRSITLADRPTMPRRIG